jgi:hypothetical protein
LSEDDEGEAVECPEKGTGLQPFFHRLTSPWPDRQWTTSNGNASEARSAIAG